MISISYNMKSSVRFNFQIILWLGIWLLLWISERGEIDFIKENVLTFLFQICLIGSIIYYAAPKLLFKNRQLLFFSMLLFSLVVFFFLEDAMTKTVSSPNHLPPPPHHKGPGFPLKPLIVHLLFLIIASLGTVFIETFIFAQKKEQETILKQNEMMAAELKLLKFQINPHFLFNALNNIYSLAGIDASKTRKSISYLSDMLRYVIYDCEKEKVNILGELTYIENYINLFKLKNKDLNNISLVKNLENKNLNLAPMILIPFVENALKHSGIELLGDTFVKIEISTIANTIEMTIANSKSKTVINKDDVGGVGLENVKRRLAIIYPEKHELEITDEENSYHVALKVNTND